MSYLVVKDENPWPPCYKYKYKSPYERMEDLTFI